MASKRLLSALHQGERHGAPPLALGWRQSHNRLLRQQSGLWLSQAYLRGSRAMSWASATRWTSWSAAPSGRTCMIGERRHVHASWGRCVQQERRHVHVLAQGRAKCWQG